MSRIGTKTASLLALALLGATPALAQPGNWNAPPAATWDRDAFWREAPSDLRQRIDWMQNRIDRGTQDGSLTRGEARGLYRQLNLIRRDARRGYRSPARRDAIQARLDDLGRQIRWQRHDGDRGGDRYGNRGDGYGNRPGDGRYDGGRPGDDRYAGNRPDDTRFATTYDASRYYRDDPRYQERRLSSQDEVYRGSDGRYYCKRSDGTTGLVIGGVGGAVLGNVIDGGHNRVAGTLIGGALGALIGSQIEKSNSDVRCR